MNYFIVEVDNDGFKVYDSAGNLIDPAKDSSVQSAVTALTAIKDTDGIKKIVDALPVGDNNIGNVDLASSIPAGTNNIGDVDIASALPAGDNNIGNVDLASAIPAGDNNIGNVDLASAIPTGDNNIGNVDIASAIPAGDNNIGNVDIASAIPTGTNEIGKVAQGTKAAAAAAWPQYLVDSTGNIVAVVLDGAVYRLCTETKIVRASDAAQINPATEETVDSIKNTDGIKKITDALPAGTNEIGKIAQGTKAVNSSAWPIKLVDGVNALELALALKQQVPTNTRGLLAVGQSDDLYARALRTDIYGNLQTIPATASQSAFGETRIAEPYQIGNLINKYEIDSNEYGTSVAGSGTVTHIAASSAIRLYVPGTSGAYAKLRTHNYYRYQAGRGMFVRLTVWNTDSGQSNQVRRWGYFDDNDGLFWELSGTTLRVVRRSSTGGSPIDYPVAQSSWNLDKLDGTGPSGITLDVTKGNIYETQYQWLGVGVVNWYVNGTLIHQMMHPNTIVGPYMRTAVLPLSWEIINTGASTTSSFHAICGSIQIEGGADQPDYTFGMFNSTDKNVTPIEIPLLSIRPKLLYNSIENRMAIVPIAASIATDGKRASYRLVLDGTLTGASFTSASTQSGVEYDETATALTGGLTLVRGLLPNSIDSRDLDLTTFFNNIARHLRRLAYGTDVNVLTIMGRNEGSSGGTTLMRASLVWQETR